MDEAREQDAHLRTRGLDRALRRELAGAYPRNHAYRVAGGRIWPGFRLWRRWRRVRALYPAPLESLVDLSCCRGYFVLRAAREDSCRRALGIDVHEPDLDAARRVGAHLALGRARFERLRLRELAERIEEQGGPFQTALLLNSYHYLYFGSERSADRHGSHAEIFALLRRVCAGRLVFSNRLELADCPRNVQRRAAALGLGAEYSAERILAAAREHFAVEPCGRLGRIPLLLLRA